MRHIFRSSGEMVSWNERTAFRHLPLSLHAVESIFTLYFLPLRPVPILFSSSHSEETVHIPSLMDFLLSLAGNFSACVCQTCHPVRLELSHVRRHQWLDSDGARLHTFSEERGDSCFYCSLSRGSEIRRKGGSGVECQTYALHYPHPNWPFPATHYALFRLWETFFDSSSLLSKNTFSGIIKSSALKKGNNGQPRAVLRPESRA